MDCTVCGVVKSQTRLKQRSMREHMTYMWNLKKVTNLFTKQKQTHIHRKQAYAY